MRRAAESFKKSLVITVISRPLVTAGTRELESARRTENFCYCYIYTQNYLPKMTGKSKVANIHSHKNYPVVPNIPLTALPRKRL
jgi:hypothetical protein